jgi:UcrQ family
MSGFWYVAAFFLGYLIYDWGEKEHDRLARKNPADFANDK